MRSANPLSSRFTVTLFTLAMIAGLALPMLAQEGREVSLHSWQVPGVPNDWTHHHLVFSDPGTEANSIRRRTHGKWLSTVNDPRYVIHQLHRSDHWLPAQRRRDDDYPRRWRDHHDPEPQGAGLQRDWNVSMGTGAHGTAGIYPAKYGASTSTASCSDFVVFPTAVGSTTVPSIIAYNNLYKAASGGCTTTTPSQFWSTSLRISNGFGGYNYSTVTTSPVLSIDGSEVAFVATINGNAYLVVLLMPTGNSSGVTTLTCNTTTNVNGTTATGSPQAWCSELSGANTDTYSSPYYDYASNSLYVGDDSGMLHKFQNVFHAYGITGASTNPSAPGEVSGSWPLQVAASTFYRLTSPVYDSTSNLIFVADSHGQVESVDASSLTIVRTTKRFSYAAIADSPIVDPTTEKVYISAPEDESSTGCTSSPYCSTVYQLPYNFAATDTGTPAVVGAGTGFRSIYDGTFDNAYYTGSGTTGNMYVCGNAGGNATLYQIPMSGTFGATVNTVHALNSSAFSTCSPVSEVYNSSASTDWLFMSVTGNGNLTGGTNNCSGACVYSYDVTGTPTYSSGLAATGGAGGIIIDTTQTVASPGGTSQIYFENLSTTTCTAGVGGCAVQASQSGLN